MKKLMKKSKRGFTLVELIIVIAILAIVAAIAIPTASNIIGSANVAADNSNAQAIEMAIKECQSEGIAFTTNQAGTFQKVKDNYNLATNPKKKLIDLLAVYGVEASALTARQSDTSYYYDSTSGKVVAATSTSAPAGSMKLSVDTKIKIDDKNIVSLEN
jgi:prepilin-type N-terminal cleavage/methylation domain-containing protein